MAAEPAASSSTFPSRSFLIRDEFMATASYSFPPWDFSFYLVSVQRPVLPVTPLFISLVHIHTLSFSLFLSAFLLIVSHKRIFVTSSLQLWTVNCEQSGFFIAVFPRKLWTSECQSKRHREFQICDSPVRKNWSINYSTVKSNRNRSDKTSHARLTHFIRSPEFLNNYRWIFRSTNNNKVDINSRFVSRATEGESTKIRS